MFSLSWLDSKHLSERKRIEMVKQDSMVPLYEQLSNNIQEKIRKGELHPGDRISSINELVNEYNVSRVTVINAIEDLLKKGFVVSRQGKGTFVRHGYIGEELMSLRSFKEIGMEQSADFNSTIVKFERADLPEKVMLALNGSESRGIIIHRLHTYKDEPIGYVEVVIPESIAERTDLTKESLGRLSMFEYFDQHGITIVGADQVISAGTASNNVYDMLNLPKGSPVLLVDRTSFDASGTPVMFGYFSYRSDAYSYKVHLMRDRRETLTATEPERQI